MWERILRCNMLMIQYIASSETPIQHLASFLSSQAMMVEAFDVVQRKLG